MASGSRRRGRILIYLALIIIVGLVLVWFLFGRNLLNLTPQPTSVVLPTPTVVQDMVDIVVTQQPISRCAQFTSDVLTTIKYPKKDLVQGTFFNKVEDVIGKRAGDNIPAQVPVFNDLALDSTEGSCLALNIPRGMVAISIPLKNRLSGLSYIPQQGDRVNVITSLMFVDLDPNFQSILPNYTASVTAPVPGIPGAAGSAPIPAELTVKILSGGQSSAQGRAESDPTLGANNPVYVQPSETQRARLVSQTLLQDARVLYVGNYNPPKTPAAAYQPTPTTVPGGQQQVPTPTPYSEPGLPDVITLIVTPQDAVTLNYLIYSGAQLTLVLRNPGDDQRVQTEAVTLQYLMDQYNIPVPAKLPFGMEPRLNQETPLALPSQFDIKGTPTPAPAQ